LNARVSALLIHVDDRRPLARPEPAFTTTSWAVMLQVYSGGFLTMRSRAS
jgi:hypothetical protein